MQLGVSMVLLGHHSPQSRATQNTHPIALPRNSNQAGLCSGQRHHEPSLVWALP